MVEILPDFALGLVKLALGADAVVAEKIAEPLLDVTFQLLASSLELADTFRDLC